MCLNWHFKYYSFFDNFCFKQPLILNIHQGMFFWLKKFKSYIEIALKPTGLKLQENPIKISYSVYICKRKRCGIIAEEFSFLDHTVSSIINLVW